MSKSHKKRFPESMAALLPDAVANTNVLELAKIRRWWLKRFQNPLRAQAQPHAVENQRLIVHVTSSTWLQELHYLKPQIMQEIRAAFPHTPINEVTVRMGPLPESTPEEPDAAQSKPASSVPMSEEFARALGRIHDDDVRAAIGNFPTKKRESED